MSYFRLICLFVCFFFKQKTAYEMRISDWSSDVCSSDLVAQQALDRPGRRVAERADGVALDLIGHVEQGVNLVEFGIAAYQARHHAVHPAGALAADRKSVV